MLATRFRHRPTQPPGDGHHRPHPGPGLSPAPGSWRPRKPVQMRRSVRKLSEYNRIYMAVIFDKHTVLWQRVPVPAPSCTSAEKPPPQGAFLHLPPEETQTPGHQDGAQVTSCLHLPSPLDFA